MGTEKSERGFFLLRTYVRDPVRFLAASLVISRSEQPTGAVFGRRAAARTGSPPTGADEDAREPAGQSGFPRLRDFWRLPLFLDGKAVKKDSGDGVHPGEVFRFVILVCTLPTFWFAFGELRNSVRCANSITAFHFPWVKTHGY